MNLFLNACGIAEPLQLSVRGPSSNERGVRLLHQPFALIGRDQRVDVPLEHSLVSRRHVYLQIIEKQGFWIDLDSRTGTFSDGQLRRSGWLGPDKNIRVGPFELQQFWRSTSALEIQNNWPTSRISPLVARSLGTQPLPEVALEFLNGPSRAASWPMNRVMSLIGSASGCKFRLADASVSPFHCSLLRTSLGLWVVDLLGPDSVSVNDALVRYALLADNDVLKIGRYRIRIHSQFPGRECERSDTVNTRSMTVPVPQPLRCNPLAPVSPNNHSGIPDSPVFHPTSSQGTGPRALMALRSEQPSNVEWVSTTNELIRLEKGEISESVLVPLVNQFGVMQQQMLDQFQQAIAMLVQMFGNLHRDHMSTIRDELDHLRDLTKEFQALKLELAARSQDQSPIKGTTNFTRSDNLEAHLVAGALSVQEQSSSGTDHAVDPAAAPIGPVSGLAPSVSAPLSDSGAFTSKPLPSTMSSQVPLSTPFSQACFNASSSVQSETGSVHPTAGGSNPEADRDVIIWLHQRMMTLQQERETRWQKILKLLPGLS
jgi:Inner membrane component of T3SS, cytoplasmic domain/FHA domain